MTDVVEILIAAKAEIVKQGWRQGPRYVDPHGDYHAYGEARPRRPGCCALDAVIDAKKSLGVGEEELRGEASAMLGLALTGNCDNVFLVLAWNDRPERTAADVYALYDKAIDMAHARAGMFAVTEALRTDDEAAP